LVSFGECTQLVQYGTSDLANKLGEGVPIIRMTNLQDDGWDFSDIKWVQLGDEEIERYRLEKGDLLFNRTNSKELVGKCVVFSEDGIWVFASYLIRVRLRDKEMLPQFASLFINSKAGRIQIDRVSRQIIGMTNVNAEELRSLQIPKPSIDKQESLVSAMDAARARRWEKLAQADELLSSFDQYFLATLGIKPPQSIEHKQFAIKKKDTITSRIDPYFHMPQYSHLIDSLKLCTYRKLAIGEISPEIVGGATPTRGDKELYADNGIRFLRILNVKSNEIDLADVIGQCNK
jgi:type I restriction enzyme S subunit